MALATADKAEQEERLILPRQGLQPEGEGSIIRSTIDQSAVPLMLSFKELDAFQPVDLRGCKQQPSRGVEGGPANLPGFRVHLRGIDGDPLRLSRSRALQY